MKKNGFTLAEVLITLAIIGVVATMTLPALLNNTGEQQYITGLKKGINTLTEAAQLSNAIDGVDYSLLVSSETADTSKDLDTTAPTLYALLHSRVGVDPQKTAEYRGTKTPPSALSADTYSGNYAIFFRDGSAVYYNPNYSHNGDESELMGDGLPRGYNVIYDVNGTKGPNVLTNCSGIKKGNVDSYNAAAPNCTEASKRVIGDQFGVRLRGNVAVPNGSAARWAFEK